MPNPIEIPDNTESIRNIGSYIMNYEPLMNMYMNALVNRIAMTIITSKSWQSPLARFHKGTLDMGETVEEIFVNLVESQSYNPTSGAETLFKNYETDVRAAFHTRNFQKLYPVTIKPDDLRAAFLSMDAVNNLIAKVVEAVYTSRAFDDYLVMKYMTVKEALNGGMFPVTIKAINTEPTDAIKKFREYSNNMLFLKTEYNSAGVFTYTEKPKQAILVDNNTEATLGVDVLANAFNMSQVDYIGNRVPIDSFEFTPAENERIKQLLGDDAVISGGELTSAQKIKAMAIDEEWYMVYTNLLQMRSQENAGNLGWNYLLHCWMTYSISPFKNAIVFTEDTSEITGVTVTPKTANVYVGQNIQMTASVEGTGLIKKTVTWSIKGNKSKGTSIDTYSGVLHIAGNETPDTAITVTATAVDGQTGTATITAKAQL